MTKEADPMVPFGEIPGDWRDALGAAASTAALAPIAAFVAAARRDDGPVLPIPERVFRALELTPFDAVRAVILGQDPYPNPEHAEGLAFSVPDTVRLLPPALVNIRTEFEQDTGLALPDSGSLEPWARHGVLLLNAVLTVKAGARGSHRHRAGWEPFTNAIIAAVAAKPEPVAYLLWGRAAQAKAALIREPRDPVLYASHPSPLSARRGAHPFRGSRPFTTADAALERRGQERIDWRLAPDPD